MNFNFRIPLFLFFFFLILPQSVSAQGIFCEELVFGGSYQLNEREKLVGNVCLVGAVGNLESGSFVEGNIYLLGGTLRVDGIVTGDVRAVGGVVDLGVEGKILGDVTLYGSELFGINQAMVGGEVRRNSAPLLNFDLPSNFWYPQTSFFRSIWNLIWLPLKSILWVGLAVLVFILFPKPVERIGDTAINQVLISGGFGLGSALVGLLISVLLAITIILIPFSLTVILAISIAWAIGIVGLGNEIGNRITKLLRQNWSPLISLGIGIFVVTIVANGFALAVPCVGWVIKILVGLIALGAVTLTRFGSQPYPLISLQPKPTDSNSGEKL